MRGISAKSRARVLDAVEGSTGPGDDLGADLFGVVAVLDSSPSLRRMLTDPSVEGEAKAQLVRTVLKDKVGGDALAVVIAGAEGRWASVRDLTDALETAGVAAIVRAADLEGVLDAVESELFELDRTVVSDNQLRATLGDKTFPAAARGELLATIFGGRVGPSTLALAKQAAVARTGSFERVLSAFADTAAARRRRLLAEVRSAHELDDHVTQRLAAALGSKYGRDVHVNLIVDPSVVGGISVSVGGEVVDGTMSSRLEAARRRLVG